MAEPSFADEFPNSFLENRHEWVLLSHTSGGNTVVNLPEHDVVVKYGRGVTREEAEAQSTALATLDPAIVYVPRVYGFFYDDTAQIGHLFMERVYGEPVEGHNHTHVEAIDAAIKHLQSHDRGYPGPLHSGEPQGILWENSSPNVQNTIQSFEDWINQWQRETINLQGEKFILCHLDTAQKNMLYMHSGQICLLDWASAGYYPRYFELAAHLKKGRPDQAVEKLLQTPCVPLSSVEEQHLLILLQPCANSMRYARPRPRTGDPSLGRRYLPTQPAMPEELYREQSSSVNTSSDTVFVGRG